MIRDTTRDPTYARIFQQDAGPAAPDGELLLHLSGFLLGQVEYGSQEGSGLLNITSRCQETIFMMLLISNVSEYPTYPT